MDANTLILALLGGSLSGVGVSLVSNVLQRPKTKAEADNLNAAASVSVSADAREWTRIFMERTDSAEHRADVAERRADVAERRAEVAEHRVDEVETGLIECYGYVRKLHEIMRRHSVPPPPLPARLEALWRGSIND